MSLCVTRRQHASGSVSEIARIGHFVAYLANEKCPLTGEVLAVQGGAVSRLRGWTITESVEVDGQWVLDELPAQLERWAHPVDCWRPVLDRLEAAGRAAVAVDLPGFGHASHPLPGRKLPQLDEFVAGVVNHYGITCLVTLVCNS